MTKISVLIPCHNCYLTLPRAVRSVVKQAGVDVEVVLIDDASTDGLTKEVIAELTLQYDNVAVVMRSENGRIAAALNSGAEAAGGDYLMRVDSDDWLTEGALARLAAVLDGNPDVAFAYGGRRYFGRASNVYLPTAYNRRAFDFHNAAGYSYLFRRAIWDNGIRWQALGTFGGAVIDLEDWQHLLAMQNAGYRGYALTDAVTLNYCFGWRGTWQELQNHAPEALATLKAKFPSVEAVSL